MPKKKGNKFTGWNCNMGGCGSPCNPIYGLGLLGAVVYYWQTSAMFSDKLLGIFKALLWPAFLVYSVLEKLAM
ncbi:MAG: hypothetical protein ABFQ62_04240 [Patescibacteria group bacterium]